jgi:hypothetical protein
VRNAFRTICILLGAAALSAAAGIAGAQAWPAKPVRLILPISAGTTSDIVAQIADRRPGVRQRSSITSGGWKITAQTAARGRRQL